MIVPATFLFAVESAGGLSSIGLDPRALLFQIVNFAILFWILKRVAYKPIVKVLEDRRAKIEESLKTAAELDKQQQEWQTEQARLLKQARAEASAVLASSQAEAKELIKAAEQKAGEQAKQLIDEAASRLGQQLAEAKLSLKRDVARLVAETTAVILDKKLDDKADLELIERTLSAGRGLR